MDEVADKYPDVAGYYDAEQYVVRNTLRSMEHDAHVKEEDGDFGKREAHGIKEEAVELFL